MSAILNCPHSNAKIDTSDCMKRKILTLLFLWCLSIAITDAQQGYSFKNVSKVEIPFEYKNNLIIVDATFQGFMPLKFIFDTGAEHSILAKKQISDALGLTYRREFKLIGSDMSTEISAFLITGIQIQMADLLLPNRAMLVLEEDHLRLEEITGMQIHGIIGSDIFKRFVVKFDYRRKVITLYKADYFKKPGRGFRKIDVEIYKNKPYITQPLWLTPKDSLNVKLLVDSGAALSLLLHSNTHESLQVPDNAVNGKLAIGLGGFIEGYLSRVQKLEIGEEFQLQEILTSFQDLNPDLDTLFLNNRNGIIGNQALSRFDVIIHYPFGKLYLRPNKNYKRAFKFDKSGLIVIAAGRHLNTFTIHDVLESSPADLAGLQQGDILKNLNGYPTNLLSLKQITDTLKKREGKRIRIVVKRDNKRMVFKFRLKKIV